jgi:hypothetical protein
LKGHTGESPHLTATCQKKCRCLATAMILTVVPIACQGSGGGSSCMLPGDTAETANTRYELIQRCNIFVATVSGGLEPNSPRLVVRVRSHPSH